MIQMSDSAERRSEAALRVENDLLRRQKDFAEGVFAEIGLGLWSFEMDEDKPPRMYGNATMDALIGCNGAEITPEEYYLAWYTRVDKAHLPAVQKVVERIIAGELAEVRYPYHHPDRGVIQVVCGGRRDMTYTKGVRIVGRHQDITELVNVWAKADTIEVIREQARIERDRAIENQHCINESLEMLLGERDLKTALERIMAMWCKSLGAQWCYIGEFQENRYLPIYGYTMEGEQPFFDLSVPGGYITAEEPIADYHGASDCLMVTDLQTHPLIKTVGSALPDEGRLKALASCCCYRLCLGGKRWGSILLLFRNRRELTPGEVAFLKAGVKGVELAIERETRMRELREERDRALAAEKARHLFFSSVSHDIRTPLNAIVGCSEMLEAGVSGEEERRKFMSTIRSSGKMLARLVNDILDLSKLESGKMVILNEPTEIPALAREIVAAVSSAYLEKGLGMETEIAEMPRVSIDAHRVRQILYNLLSNAFKYTSRGCVRLKTTWRDATLTLSVSDTGKGISKEDVAKILKPFVQVVDCNHRDGTGLGLSICQRLVQLMGGELRIESEPGKGSVFTVVLSNVARVDEMPTAVREPSQAASEPPVRVRRVLVVDDSPVNLMVTKAMLGRCGVADVVTAGNGQKALDILRRDPAFDVVLTDLWMPELDGEGLVRAIREDPALAHLPVYVVTADVEAVGTGKEKGFTGVLLKPITQAGVRELLTTA